MIPQKTQTLKIIKVCPDHKECYVKTISVINGKVFILWNACLQGLFNLYAPKYAQFQLQNLLIKRVAKTLHNSKGSPSKLNFYKAYLIGDDILNKRLL